MKKPLLVTLADKNYLEYAKQVFAGAYFNAGWKGDYMLLAHDVPEKNLKWFRKKGILIKHCRPIFKERIVGLAPTVYSSKLYLFKTEFRNWSHVIYIDCDTLIRASLNGLLKTRGFGAVCREYNARFRSEFKTYREFVDFDPMSSSFSAGFFVFDTSIICNSTFLELVDLYRKYKNSATSGDQPILNLYFYNSWQELPFIFNVCTTEQNQWRINPSKLNAIVLHITGPKGNKPWQIESIFFKEWQKNFLDADKINLKHIPEGKHWSESEIRDYSDYLLKRYFFWGRYDLLIWHLEQYYYATLLLFEKKMPLVFRWLKKFKKRLKMLYG